MDLTAALENFSEFFVAANTRTSLTEFAESVPNSLSSLNNINMNSHNSLLFNDSSSPLHKQYSASLSQPSSSLDQLGCNSTDDLDEHLDNDLDCNISDDNPLHSMHNSTTNHQDDHLKYQDTYVDTSPRLPQPIRTQLPIHCLIEQFDSCSDLSEYQSLNDNELFRTADLKSPSKPSVVDDSHESNNNSINNSHQSHLHQSKLALESVTSGLSTSPSTPLSTPVNPPSITHNGDEQIFNANTAQQGTSSLPSHLDPQPDATTSKDNLEQTNILNDSAKCNSSYIDNNQRYSSFKETYVIVANTVLYIDLVRTVMLQLGYTAMDIINAKATLEIRNWKPLALNQVTDDKRATVGEVLSDICSIATLRIKIYSSVPQLPGEWSETMIRQIVLALTQTMSQLTLSKLCNISQPLISAIVRGGKKLGRRKCAEFGEWYLNYIKSSDARPLNTSTSEKGAGLSGNSSVGGTTAPSSGRLVFDKTREIPRLKAWFANNTKPTEEQLKEYSDIMNDDTLRKGRPQVSAKALKNWWKNERQKLGIRQREIRGRPKLKIIDQ